MRLLLTCFVVTLMHTVASADEVALFGSESFGTVVVIPIPEQSFVSTHLIIAVGAAEDEGREGLAHFAEHSAFVGARIATDYQGSINAITSLKTTEFYSTHDLRSLPNVVKFYSAALLGQPISQEAFETERIRIRTEIQEAVNAPISRLEICSTREKIFENEPWKSCVLGQIDVIENITIDEVSIFQERYYKPNKAVLVISGPIELAEIQRLIPPSREPTWMGAPLDPPEFRSPETEFQSNSTDRLVVGSLVVNLPSELDAPTQSALLVFTSIWGLDPLEVALEKYLRGTRYVARNFGLLLEPLGNDIALLTISIELERGMLAKDAVLAMKAAIESVVIPELDALIWQRQALLEEARKREVFSQILLAHLRNRNGPMTGEELLESVEMLQLYEIDAIYRLIFSTESWRFFPSY